MAYIEIKLWCDKHTEQELEATAHGQNIHVEPCERCKDDIEYNTLEECLEKLGEPMDKLSICCGGDRVNDAPLCSDCHDWTVFVCDDCIELDDYESNIPEGECECDCD